MKWMIASDLHGSAYYCKMMLQAYDRENADRLLLLGDLLYHGPRNDLPKEYAPKEVITLLNGKKEDICCIQGNCDADVDQMVLNFPIMAQYCVLDLGSGLLYASHGHVFNYDHLPLLKKGDIFLQGHTHVPVCEEHNGILCMNPGSVSIPKDGSCHSYMTFEDGVFLWKDILTGESYRKYIIVQ